MMPFITRRPIPVARFLSERPPRSCGAVVHFVGYVRNRHQGKIVRRLFYDCYRSMAECEMARLVDSIRRQTRVELIRVVHRIGWLSVGEAAVVVWVASPHRAQAFEACRLMIDRLKSEVPIWKQEIYEDGSSQWSPGSCVGGGS